MLSFRQSGHFTADQLLQDARKSGRHPYPGPRFTAASPFLLTVGRCVRSMSARTISFMPSTNRVPLSKPRLFARIVTSIFDVDAPFMEWYGRTVSEKLGLEVSDQRLQVQASCPAFAEARCLLQSSLTSPPSWSVWPPPPPSPASLSAVLLIRLNFRPSNRRKLSA